MPPEITKPTKVVMRNAPKILRDCKKKTNIKFHGNPSSGSRAYMRGQTEGRTDGHEEGNRPISHQREGA
jgi:hypothetical protein